MYIITPKKTQNVILKYTIGCFYDVLGTPIVVWGTIWHGISFAVLKQCTSILLGTNKTLSSILENHFLGGLLSSLFNCGFNTEIENISNLIRSREFSRGTYLTK